MSPQFVDYDADGILDIVAATFDGSPHLSRGTKQGFLQPVQILDRDGARILMNQFWNRDVKPEKWDDAKRCDPEGWSESGLHLTSAWAVDWDADGDLDLLLGDHNKGFVMLRRNEGDAKVAKFATRNEPILASGAPMVVKGTVATLRTIDWDRDGRMDVLVGTMGDAYGEGPGGAVLLYRNESKQGEARFGEPTVIVAASARGQDHPSRPDAGLYMDAADFDGDGDLDLVVGGYSTWNPPKKPLDEEQAQRAAKLKDQIAAEREELMAAQKRTQAAIEALPESEREARSSEIAKQESSKITAVFERMEKLQEELDALVPSMQRRSFTWLYESLETKAAR